MIINGLQKLTLLDFPGYVACTIFTRGCNFRCPFCQNKALVLPECFDNNVIPEEEILSFLNERRNRLQGICISGGEPTLQSDLRDFIVKVKDMGYKVKLDTNGTNPEILEHLLQENLLDYIAMDIKNSMDKYGQTSGRTVVLDDLQPNADIYHSIRLIQQSGVRYEFRTTVIAELHTDDDFENIGKMLGHADAYSLQYYADSDGVIMTGFHAPTDEDMLRYKTILSKYVDSVQIKGR